MVRSKTRWLFGFNRTALHLTPYDFFRAPPFFLWEYLKADTYKNRPLTLEALKEAIIEAIAEIPQDMLRRAYDNLFELLNMQYVD